MSAIGAPKKILRKVTMTTIARPPGAVIRRSPPIPPDQLEADLLIRWEEQTVIRQRQLLQTLYKLLFTPSPAMPPSILPQFMTNQHFPSVNHVTEIPEAAYPTSPGLPQAERSNVAHSRVTGDAESTSSGASSSSGFDIPLLQTTSAERRDSDASKTLQREAYDQYVKEIDRLFDPLTNESEHSDGFVFLCWGDATSCRIQGVKHFQHDMDDVLFWKKLNTAWFQARGEWRRKIPWYGIRNVQVADVRLAGPVTDVPEEFHGTYQILDEQLEAEKRKHLQVVKKLQVEEDLKDMERMIKEKRRIDNHDYDYDYDYYDDYDLDQCIYDQRLNRVDHSNACSWANEESEDTEVCGVEERYTSQDKLNGLLMEPLRTSLFRNPKLALYHKLSNKDLVHFKR